MLHAVSPKNGICGDICEPLISLWKMIQSDHESLLDQYEARWKRLQESGETAFREIRKHFNETKDPADLMFLSRTCVNGLIRFNKKGEFNNTLHHTRKGIDPKNLKPILDDWHGHLRNMEFRIGDYQETTQDIQEGDFMYLDPPYFNTKGMYFGTIDFGRFIEWLDGMNRKGVKYALSFDGKRGDDDYTVELPKELYTRHLMLPSGHSTFRKIMGKKSEPVFESLYLNYEMIPDIEIC